MTAPVRQGRHIIANGIRLHYIKFTSGLPPLVLLPGITSPAATWEFVAERLAVFFDVYVLDIRGRGLSQGGENLSYLLDDYAADVEAFNREVGLEKPVVLGHSMGARIAIRFARRYPAQMGELILVDPPVSGPGRRSYPVALEFYLDSLELVSRGEGLDEMRKKLPWSPEKLEQRMQWLPTCDRTAIIESYKSFHDEDIHSDLPELPMRTLLLYAEYGDTVTDKDADELAMMIKHCKKQRIDGAGHMIPWDRLDAFVAAISNFFGKPLASNLSAGV